MFESGDEGFCVIAVLFEDDEPIDYRFRETNPAFARQSGLVVAEGRRNDGVRDRYSRAETHAGSRCRR